MEMEADANGRALSNRTFASFRVADLLALFTLLLLVLCTYSPSLRARLDVRKDDHRIAFFSAPLESQHEQVRTEVDVRGRHVEPTLAWFLRTDVDAGRFRPFTQAAEVYLPRVLGTNAVAWHAFVLVVSLLIATALFCLGRALGGSWLEGLALAGMVLLAPEPGPAKVWYLMSVKAEQFGSLFTVLSLLATCRAARSGSKLREEMLPLLLLLVAAMFKEPFALLLPAMLLIRLGLPWFEGRASSAELRPSVSRVLVLYACFALLYGSALALGLSASPADSYGTKSLHEWNLLGEGLLSILKMLPLQAAGFLVPMFAIVLIARTRGLRAAGIAFGWLSLIAGAWIGPQVALYALRGGLWDHYWMPATIGIAGANAWGLHALRSDGHRRALAAACAFLALWGLNGMRTNLPAVENYVRMTQLRGAAVDAVVARVPANGTVVVVADNAIYSEYAMSWILFAANEGRAGTRYLLYDVTRKNSAGFTRSFFFPHATPLANTAGCTVDAIVFLNQPQPADAAWKNWYRPGCFETKTFATDQVFLSSRRLELVHQPATLDVAFRSKAP